MDATCYSWISIDARNANFRRHSRRRNYKSILRPRASRWLASGPSSLSDLPSVAARMMLAFPQNLSEI
jgi:hypothetical protein